MAVAMFIVLACPVQAKRTTSSPTSGRHYRISYAGNGRYLDIPAEGYYNNGTQLQLWDYAYGNQNQIFRLDNTDNGWRIVSQNGRILEVRDSRHDDCAPVAQWDAHDLNCGRWNIRTNNDGTVSFQNRESGKFLNVEGGGDAQNGNKLIQYYDDGTVAMRFRLEVLGDSDVLSASYQRDLYYNDIQWTQFNPLTSYIYNLSGWSKQEGNTYYYPSVGQKVFLSKDLLSPYTVGTLIHSSSYKKSTMDRVKAALRGELSESDVWQLGKDLGLNHVPYIGKIFAICKVLVDMEENPKWNSFLDAAHLDQEGHYSGVIVYTYLKINRISSWGPLNNGTTAWGTQYYIRKVPVVSYGTWTGDNFGDVCGIPAGVQSGSWSYEYK